VAYAVRRDAVFGGQFARAGGVLTVFDEPAPCSDSAAVLVQSGERVAQAFVLQAFRLRGDQRLGGLVGAVGEPGEGNNAAFVLIVRTAFQREVATIKAAESKDALGP